MRARTHNPVTLDHVDVCVKSRRSMALLQIRRMPSRLRNAAKPNRTEPRIVPETFDRYAWHAPTRGLCVFTWNSPSTWKTNLSADVSSRVVALDKIRFGRERDDSLDRMCRFNDLSIDLLLDCFYITVLHRIQPEKKKKFSCVSKTRFHSFTFVEYDLYRITKSHTPSANFAAKVVGRIFG